MNENNEHGSEKNTPTAMSDATCINGEEHSGGLRGIPFALKPVTVIVGHYGVGKTNLALNVALDAVRVGKHVTLIDLDIINPYFRSSDYAEQLALSGVNVISPVHAGTSLDVPSLSGTIYPAIESADDDHLVIVDVGGDDAGATSLGRFSEEIEKKTYQMLYVINAYRNLTQTAQEAVNLMHEIEARSKLTVDGLINNSHLKEQTTFATIEKSSCFAEEVATLTDLPLVATTIPDTIVSSDGECLGEVGCQPKSSVLLSSRSVQNPYVVQVYVRTLWEL